MTDNGLIWESPPNFGDHKANAGYWPGIVEKVRARPNEWAMVYEQEPGQSEGSARNRRVMIGTAAKRMGVPFEVTTRIVNGRVRVYARTVTS